MSAWDGAVKIAPGPRAAGDQVETEAGVLGSAGGVMGNGLP